ncbi:uncharacterized protein LOC123676417 [Harmonia axyridis]|uniref:uncharacterized protein LOC123676417 n=1 Tax=Harmonia axyridis TaxID=115357 RepID=UPI001E274FF4|nr:uncharacterized protein LOC123676417 [Harmonia axyridis]
MRQNTSNEKVLLPLFSEFNVEDTHPFVLYKFHRNYDGLIGADFLNKYGINLNFQDQILENEFCNIPFKYQQVCQNPTKIPVDLSHLESKISNQLMKILQTNENVLQLPNQPLSFSSRIKHKIRTTDDVPVHCKIYRYPEVHREEVKKQIKDLLDKNIIRPSISPWSFPVVIVPKKEDLSGKVKWRMAIDYRKLNDKTIDDKYPLPQIDSILDKLGNKKYFTTLDLASGFHQIEMDEESIEKTAFTVDNGHYEFLRMPFGLKNAPATFQRLMNNTLKDYIGKICHIYMDDIIIFSETVEQHLADIHTILETLMRDDMKIQLDKCHFFKTEIEFLGHIITPEGIKPNPKKLEAVTKLPIPKTPKEIKSFLGLVGYYRKFIPNFAKIAKPLTACLKKEANINIDDIKYVEAFQVLKRNLLNHPILCYPDFNKPFVLTTDASGYAIGSVLSQGTPPGDLPIAYASRTLSQSETKYSTIEKELLAILFSCKFFRPYLYGRKFIIYTDHKPLTWLFSLKEPNSRLMRWRIKLEEFDYEIRYRKGSMNNADALSRIVIENEINFENFIKLNEMNEITDSPNVKEKEGNLFKAPKNYALAHCVSKDFHMSRGIAVCFKNKYGNIEKLKSQNKMVGQVAKIRKDNRNIYYLITKENYYDKPTYENVFKSLKELREICEMNNEKYLAIPRISSGLDRLKWSTIFNMIKYIFLNLNIKITIFYLPNKNGNEIKQIEASNMQMNDLNEIEEINNGIEDDLVSIINQVTDEELDECLELLNAGECENDDSNENEDENIIDFETSNVIIHDDVTIHSSIENPIFEIPYTERSINSANLQVIFKKASNYDVTKIKLFGEKLRFLVSVNSVEIDLCRFIREYLRPKSPYTIYFKSLELEKPLIRILQEKFDYKSLDLKISRTLVEDVEDKEEQLLRMKQFHETKTSHRGLRENLLSLKRKYYWPNMNKDIQNYINTCEICQKSKYERTPVQLQFKPNPVGTKPFTHVYCDTIKFNQTNCLSVIDSFSRFGQCYPLLQKTGSEIMDKLLIYFSHYGIPNKITCDNGIEFKNNVIQDFCKVHKIEIHYITNYNPNSNALVERFHSTLIEQLRTIGNKNLTFQNKLAQALLSYNNSNHSSLEMTPMQIIKADLNYSLPIERTHNEQIQNYVENYLENFNDISKHLEKRQEKNLARLEKTNKKRSADRPLNENPTYIKNPKTRKLDPAFKRIDASEIDSHRIQDSKNKHIYHKKIMKQRKK